MLTKPVTISLKQQAGVRTRSATEPIDFWTIGPQNSPIKQLDFVISDEDGFVWDFLDEAFLFSFSDVEIKSSRRWNQKDS